ncbi:hypothetical protein SBY92_003394 [Candida maltosa Xu316]
MYTMTNFLFPPKDWNFKVKNLPNASKKDKWLDFNSKKSPYILIKIGMTTQTPKTRIKQWQEKCHHDLTNIGPPNKHLVIKQRQSLLARLMCMSIEDPQYCRWTNEGFHCRNLKTVESTIHRELRMKYGKGDVYCVGCLNDNVHRNANFNVHVEWFLIPKRDITDIYQLIDSTCVQIG